MASLVDADAQRPTPAALLLSWSKFAERKHGYELPPEWRTALALDRGLTRELQIPRVGADAADPATPDPAPKPAETMVRRSIDAFTPWLFFKLAFADAMKLADDPSQWHLAARQMITVLGDCPHLPRNGALWRRQMTKRTRLTLSLQPGLATQETIEIRAEGHDDGVGGGYRNYSHFLLSAADGPGLLKLTEDTGRIEIRGDGKGIMLRIRKRVTVELGRSVDERFGSTMSLGLSLLLWLWAWGFRDATQSPSDHPNNQVKSPAPDLPAELKQKSANPDVKNCIKVAVLGGGPAGMACAWLLSNPMGPGGQNAWTASQNTPAIKVDLFEKDYRLGGKAASGRRIDDDGKFRIEEHGLHVLMGCYANLLEVLKWLGVDGDCRTDDHPHPAWRWIEPSMPGSFRWALGPRSDDRSLLAWYMAERSDATGRWGGCRWRHGCPSGWTAVACWGPALAVRHGPARSREAHPTDNHVGADPEIADHDRCKRRKAGPSRHAHGHAGGFDGGAAALASRRAAAVATSGRPGRPIQGRRPRRRPEKSGPAGRSAAAAVRRDESFGRPGVSNLDQAAPSIRCR
jgi:hypothetical protein